MRFVLCILLTYVIGAQLAYLANSIWLYALVTLPGTFLHELLHYSTALLLQGHPTGFSLIPAESTLGQVLIQPNWYNAATIALAPLFLAPLTILFSALAARTRLWYAVLFLYLGVCSWASCIPSSADFKIALSTPSSWPLACAVFGIVTVFSYRIVQRVLR